MRVFSERSYFHTVVRDNSPTDYQNVRWSCQARGCDMPASRSDPSSGTPLCLQHRRRLHAEPMRAPSVWSTDVIEACNVLGLHADDATPGAVRQRAQFLQTVHSVGRGEQPLGEERSKHIERAARLLLAALAGVADA